MDSETKKNHNKYFNYFYSLTLKFLLGVKFHFANKLCRRLKFYVHVLVPVFAAYKQRVPPRKENESEALRAKG